MTSVQTCFRHTVGFIPGHHNKVSIAINRKSHLWFIKYAILVKHNKMKCNKMRCACTWMKKVRLREINDPAQIAACKASLWPLIWLWHVRSPLIPEVLSRKYEIPRAHGNISRQSFIPRQERKALTSVPYTLSPKGVLLFQLECDWLLIITGVFLQVALQSSLAWADTSLREC